MKIFIFILINSLYLFSFTTDGIAIKVNDEIITMFDIDEAIKETKTNKKEAIELLIDILVKKEAIKNMGISTDLDEIHEYIQNIAKSNNMNFLQFKTSVSNKIPWNTYKTQVKNKLQNDKFIQKIIATHLSSVDSHVFYEFYLQNKDNFRIFETITATLYSSNNQQLLLSKIQNPMSNPQGITIKEIKISKKDFEDKNVYNYLENMKINTFSPMVQSKSKVVSYFVTSKQNPKYLKYKQVLAQVQQLYSSSNAEKIIQQHLESIKSSLHIVYVR